MAVDAEDLLIRPFRDVVAAGTVALNNASTYAPPQGTGSASHVNLMSRAAQALLREGERALSKVQLLWDDRTQQHGDAFRDMMVQQGETACQEHGIAYHTTSQPGTCLLT